MLSAVGRAVVTFLLGVVVGAAGMGWLFSSGAGDMIMRHGSVVQDLERRLDDVEAQRDQLGRSLEDVVRRAEESEARFHRLEERLQSMIAAAERAPAPNTPPAPKAPPTSVPSGGQPEGE
jgi:hypothetical protein